MKKSKKTKYIGLSNVSRLVLSAAIAVFIGISFADYTYAAWGKSKAKATTTVKGPVLKDPGAGDKARLGDVIVNTISGTGSGLTGIPAAGITGTALVESAIGSTVEAYDATILKDADIGSTIQAYSANLDTLALNNGSSLTNIQPAGVVGTALVATDIGSTVEGYDVTILKDADIGSTIQAYSANLDTLALNNGASLTNVQPAGVVGTALIASAIGSTVQAYSANLDTLALNNGASLTNIQPAAVVGTAVVATDIGSTVQAYSANLDKLALNDGGSLTNVTAIGGSVGGHILIEMSGITGTVYMVSDSGVTNVMGTYWKE